MKRTSSSSSTVKMTTGGNNRSDSAPIETSPLSEISSTSSRLSSLSDILSPSSTDDRSTTHVEYLTKLIHRVDERDSNCRFNEAQEAKPDNYCSNAPSTVCLIKKESDILDSSAIQFRKLNLCDEDKGLTEKTRKDAKSQKQKMQLIYEPISKKLNNMQRIKGIEYALSNKNNTNPNKDHSLTTKCDNNVTCITSLPPHIKILPKTQSLDRVDDDDASTSCIVVSNQMSNVNIVVHNHSSVVAKDGVLEIKGTVPKLQTGDQSRPIYPSLNFSPYASPFSSPRSGRKRAPLRESRRVSIEQNGSFLFLNQYKLMDEIGQVNIKLLLIELFLIL